MAYSTVLFDLDYTLFDSDTSQREAIATTIDSLDIDHPDPIETFLEINGKLWRDVEAGRLSPNDVRTLRFAQFLDRVRIDADAAVLGDRYVRALGLHGELYTQARRVLEHLAGTVNLALITNGIGDVQRERIARLDLERYFDAMVISGEVGVAKPGTEIFDIAFERLSHPPKDTAVIVGDSLTSDIAGGRAFGIDTCWYNPGVQPTNSVLPDHVIAHLDEVIGIVDGPAEGGRIPG